MMSTSDLNVVSSIDGVQLPLQMSTSAKASSLDLDSIEGLMIVHRKKPKKQRFLLHKSAHYVVANAMKHALEIYNNESRSELVYLLSLADAVLSFESDNANIVMEKCFCVEVKTWKKKSTVHLQPQGFIFFGEDQARMLLWVKCIHLAIKRATTLDSELFRTVPTSQFELVRRFSDSDNPRVSMESAADGSVGTTDADQRCASNAFLQDTAPIVSIPSSPSSTSGFAAARDKLTQRLVIDPAARIVTAGRTILTPTRSSSSTGERMPSASRWSNMFSHDKQQQTRSPMSSAATDSAVSPVDTGVAAPKGISWKRSTKAATDVTSDTLSSADGDPSSPVRLLSSRATSPPTSPSRNDSAAVASSGNGSAVGKKQRAAGVVKSILPLNASTTTSEPPPIQHKASLSESEKFEDFRLVTLSTLTIMLGVATYAGTFSASVFLPIATAGTLSHLYGQHNQFTSWTFCSLAVYLASTSHVLFGLGLASVFVYMWSYANFKTQRRRHAQRTALIDFRTSHSNQANSATKHFEVPNWMRHPDVDRVEWLNKVFSTGWPYLKIAIRDSVLASLNPVLDAQKPAFMNTLSLGRMDLGTKTPQVCGVKFISANTLTDEVTLDVDIRVVTDKSFVAEIKMVSHLGAAVCMTLRELFLVGTLRITLNPLATYWPCFRALNLSFTTRPVFDFSLTAAKINIANVPFVSEWLHTFLYDLLIDYFVWPKVVDIPLWDEHGNPAQYDDTKTAAV